MLEEGAPLPERCAITPMAEEFFRGSQLATADLLASLRRMDRLLSGE